MGGGDVGHLTWRPKCVFLLLVIVITLKVLYLSEMVLDYTESNGDWLLRRPSLTQGCSAERKEGNIRLLE